MPMLEIRYRDLGHTLACLNRIGITAGKDVAVGASTLRISEKTIDNAIAQILKDKSPQPILSEALRENFYITPGSEARNEYIATQRQYVAQEISHEDYRAQRREIRQKILGKFLPLHIDPTQHNLIYGLNISGCKPAIADGAPRRCDLLIHATHPVSSEDLWLREQGIEAKTITHAIVLGFDEPFMQRWNDLSPSIPMTAEQWRKLLYARSKAH